MNQSAIQEGLCPSRKASPVSSQDSSHSLRLFSVLKNRCLTLAGLRSMKYEPLDAGMSGSEARYTLVEAPFSAVRRNGRNTLKKKFVNPPALLEKLVATVPGCRDQVAVTRPAFDIRPDLLHLFGISGMQHHMHPLSGQFKGGDIPDAGSGTGNQGSAFRCSVFRHG